MWSSPGRVNLIGDHTDYTGGLALPFAIPARTAVAAGPRTDGLLTFATSDRPDAADRPADPSEPAVPVTGLAPGAIPGWAAYPAGTAWALRRHGVPIRGADLVVAGEVPIGAGLSSSAALTCATALALLGLAGLEPDEPGGPDHREVATLARIAENDAVGVPTGPLDQIAAMCATDGHALALDVTAGSVDPVRFDPAADHLTLLAVNTLVRRRVAESAYADRRAGCHRAETLLGLESLRTLSDAALTTPGILDDALARLPDELCRLVRHVCTENARVSATVEALRSAAPRSLALPAVGALLTESHASLRDHYRVSCPELDLAVQAALSSGALGARMTGAGFGGSVVVLAHASTAAAVATSIRDAFAEHGWSEPGTQAMAPSAGAGRDR